MITEFGILSVFFETFLLFTMCLALLIFFVITKVKKTNKVHTEVVQFLGRNRSFWNKVKLYSLTFNLLIPNYVYIYSIPWYLWTISFVWLYLLGDFSAWIYYVLAIKIYYAIISFLFGFFYEKTPRFENFINRTFFENNSTEARYILGFFFGNMWKKAAKVGASTGTVGKMAQKIWGDEEKIADLTAQTQVDWAHQKTLSQPNANSLPPKTEAQFLADKASLKQEVLAQQPLHSVANTTQDGLKAAKTALGSLFG
jgi:hypothetical protein